MRRRLTQAAVMLTALAPAASPAQDAAPAGLGLSAGQGVLWVHRRDITGSEQPHDLLRFAYQYTDGSRPNRFWPGPIVMGRISHSVATDKGLHVFFEDGAHHYYLPDPRVMGRDPPFVDLGDLDLPLQTAPVAACWDAKSEQLFVVITAAQAVELARTQREPADESADDDLGNSGEAEPDDHAEDPSGPPNIDTPFVVARHTPRRWIIDRPTPRDLTADDRIAGMLASDLRIHVFYRTDDDAHDYRHLTSASPEAAWSEATALPLPHTSKSAAFGWFDDQPIAIIVEDAPGGVTIGSMRLMNGAWQTGPLLAKNAAEPVRLATPMAVTQLGTSVAVAFPTLRGDIQIGTWSIAQGGPETTPLIVAPLSPTQLPQVNPASRHLLQYALFLAMLGAMFVWRRDKVMVLVPLGPNQQYARTSCRMLALVLDLVILSPVWGLTLYRVLEQSGDGVSIAEQLLQNAEQKSTVWFFLGAIIGAIFAVYAALFERLMGATPGKRIVGCSVVGEGGRPGSFRSILIRNALRPIEFHFSAIALLVFFTPSRQRLGDIFAGTVVVETRPEGDADAATIGEDPPEDDDDDAPI